MQIASVQAEVSLIDEILRAEIDRIEQFALNNQRMNSLIDNLAENIDAFLSANACTNKEGDASSCTLEEDDKNNASTGIEGDKSESSVHDDVTNDEDDDESVMRIVFSDGSLSLNDLSARHHEVRRVLLREPRPCDSRRHQR